MSVAPALVLLEAKAGALSPASLELLLGISSSCPAELHAVLLAPGARAAADEAATLGATVHYPEHSAPDANSIDLLLSTLVPLLQQLKPSCVLAYHAGLAVDLLPRLAILLGGHYAPACAHAEWSKEGRLIASRPIFGGKILGDVVLGTETPFVTLRGGALPTIPASRAAGAVHTFTWNTPTKTSPVKLLSVTGGKEGRIDLSEARVVISGGRGMKTADSFALLEALAGEFKDSAVGASRSAVEAGFRPQCDQVGQTGRSVSPDLYLACGISGAIQHVAGTRGAKLVVAVNNDAEAPIFQSANVGIVADLFQFLPVLTRILRESRRKPS